MTLRYSIEYEDYQEAAAATARIVGDWMRLLRIAGYAATATGFLCFFIGTPSGLDRIAPVALCLTGLFVLIYPEVEAGRQTRIAWLDEQEGRTDDITVEAGADGLTFNSPRSRLWWDWSRFSQVVETRRLFVLCSGIRTILAIVPKRCFADAEQLAVFRSMLAEHVQHRTGGFPVVPR